jgi:RimJ/RimL family protein N-acetyltransferase
MERWDNDPELIPYIRPCATTADQHRHVAVSVDSLLERLQTHRIFLIYADGNLVGEVNYSVDPPHLYRQVPKTAWIGITIGERDARRRGIGTAAMEFIEGDIRDQHLSRIELGVFEFNTSAQSLYRKLGYREIGRIDDFTYWNGRMWQDVRLEKLLV